MAKPKLTALFVKSTARAAGRYGDGGGLYLMVRDGGARSWVFRYRERGTGKQRDLGLGAAAGPGSVALDDARERAGELRAGLRRGVDPAAAKKADRATGDGTFGTFADALLESIKSGFKNPKSEKDWKRDLVSRCAALRPKGLKHITTDDVLEVLKPWWTTKPRTARELRGRIERVLDAAKAKGLRSGENPRGGKAT